MRYARQISLPWLTERGQRKLLSSSVFIIGAGGLGSPVALYLAGAGLGQISIADDDNVRLSNLHRQVAFRESDIGQNKAEILAREMKALNSDIHVEAYPVRLNKDNILDLIEGSELVIDCTDNMDSRYLINDACVLLDKAFISASVYRNEGQVGLFNFKGSGTYRCLFPEARSQVNVPDCEDVGVLGSLCGLMSMFQASEAIKCLVGQGDLLINKVLYTNTLNNSTSSIEYNKNEEAISQVKQRASGYFSQEKSSHNHWILNELTGVNLDDYFLVDLREENEIEGPDVPGSLKYSLQEIAAGSLSKEKTGRVLCFCQSGSKALQAVNLLRDQGWVNAFAYRGNIESISGFVKNENYK